MKILGIMPRLWNLKPLPPGELSLIDRLLYHRGLTNKETVEKFLDPQYEDLNNPFLFADMKKAVDRIWQAVEHGDGICIYGDYDADAVTANAVVQLALRYLGVEVKSYIPDRFTEGYGVNMEALQKIKDGGAKVIITVDCGTNSGDAAEFCAQNGMDLIITDHHELIGPAPAAYALINPKNPADNYPYHEITGVGVAFKLVQGLFADEAKCKNFKPDFLPGYEKWLLDLVAIGTVADCHSLMGENRILVKYGLKVLAKTKWAGLRALTITAGLDFNQKLPDTYTLGFVIAPRLNAAGRLEHADTALHLVLEADPILARQKALALEKINSRRQEQTARIMSEAREQAEKIFDRKVIVVAGEGWNKGIVGLVAGKLAEEFHKPAIVLEKTPDECTGSARTVGEFDVVEALKFSSDYLLRFGGHKQAAGLTLKTKNLEKFYQKILEYAEANIKDDDLQKQLLLDAELLYEDLTLKTCDLLNQMEPFGVDNVKPKFLVRNLNVVFTRGVGKDGSHLQLRLRASGFEVDGILFNCGDFAKTLQMGDTIDVAAELLEDSWNGNRKIKLRIIDFKKL
jgi:single-stranded-DNA-specific exonuclease